MSRLLGAALPNGPEGTRGMRKIDYKSEKTGIQFATPSAQGFISAPWHVSGDVNVLAPDEVEYQLSLTAAGTGNSAGQGAEYTANFEGRLSKVTGARIDDSMPLDGWNLFGVGVQTRTEGNGTAVDYGAAPTPAPYKTVADIRKKLAEDDYPGERDPSKNFTGFWKEDCEQAFGLQIMPHGTDGKYSIAFAGPVDVEIQIPKGALRSSQKTETTKSSTRAKSKSVVPMVGDTPTTCVRKIPIQF